MACDRNFLAFGTKFLLVRGPELCTLLYKLNRHLPSEQAICEILKQKFTPITSLLILWCLFIYMCSGQIKRLISIEKQLIILDRWITVQIGNGPSIICAGVICFITDQMLKSSCIKPHMHLLICTHRSVQWTAVDISVPGINPHTQSSVEMDSWKVFCSYWDSTESSCSDPTLSALDTLTSNECKENNILSLSLSTIDTICYNISDGTNFLQVFIWMVAVISYQNKSTYHIFLSICPSGIYDALA